MPIRTSLSNKTPAARRGVVGVIVRERRLLVIERSQHVVAPGAICFPGGGMLPGESEEQTLQRELQEELHVEVKPLQRLWRSETSWNVALSWWQAELLTPETLHPNPQEVAMFQWLFCDELARQQRLLSSNQDFLQAAGQGEFVIDGLK